MEKKRRRRIREAGLPPGTVVPRVERPDEPLRVILIKFGREAYSESHPETVEEAVSQLEDDGLVAWLNIEGIHEVEPVRKVGERFSIHPLVLEDIVNPGQRPKVEEFDDYLFVIFRMIHYRRGNEELDVEQISLILREGLLITFQERAGDLFEPVRERLRKGMGRIRAQGADYLAYCLIDLVVDHYFAVLDEIGEEVEGIEDKALENPDPALLRQIHSLRRKLIELRKSIFPLREVVSSLERGENSLVGDSTRIFLRDLYDHTIRVIEMVESLRDLVAGILDVYLSSVSNRMNEVMKVLTAIATIFIPLTFLAGVYGMNFRHMPELEWKWGYPAVWMVFLVIGISLFIYFKRKKWL
ncbi:MAG: magnesium and cobalt transport protein CorA [Deltaproteobacteria bacterium]|nr:MAG: magnesium and cobalt transport protein CorA [Deltaproteobacteria bacterium]